VRLELHSALRGRKPHKKVLTVPHGKFLPAISGVPEEVYP